MSNHNQRLISRAIARKIKRLNRRGYNVRVWENEAVIERKNGVPVVLSDVQKQIPELRSIDSDFICIDEGRLFIG